MSHSSRASAIRITGYGNHSLTDFSYGSLTRSIGGAASMRTKMLSAAFIHRSACDLRANSGFSRVVDSRKKLTDPPLTENRFMAASNRTACATRVKPPVSITGISNSSHSSIGKVLITQLVSDVLDFPAEPPFFKPLRNRELWSVCMGLSEPFHPRSLPFSIFLNSINQQSLQRYGE